MTPSTLGPFLRAFTFGHVRQLEAVVGETLRRKWAMGGAGAGHRRRRGPAAHRRGGPGSSSTWSTPATSGATPRWYHRPWLPARARSSGTPLGPGDLGPAHARAVAFNIRGPLWPWGTTRRWGRRRARERPRRVRPPAEAPRPRFRLRRPTGEIRSSGRGRSHPLLGHVGLRPCRESDRLSTGPKGRRPARSTAPETLGPRSRELSGFMTEMRDSTTEMSKTTGGCYNARRSRVLVRIAAREIPWLSTSHCSFRLRASIPTFTPSVDSIFVALRGVTGESTQGCSRRPQ